MTYKQQNWLIGIGIAAAALGLNAFLAHPDAFSTAKYDLCVVSLTPHTTEAFGHTLGTIEGVVQNQSGHTYRHITLKINLYDENGALVGQTEAGNDTGLEPHGSWHYSAPVMEHDAKSCKVAGISGY